MTATPATTSTRRTARRRLAACLAAALMLAPLAIAPRSADAQGTVVPAVESRLYFGMSSEDGSGVSEQEFATFLRDEVTPRFPDGLTLVSVYGQSSGSTAPNVIQERTKLLILVHEDTPEAAAKLAELKEIYRERYGQIGVFHTRSPVEIVVSDGAGD